MKNAAINVKIDPEVKAQAEAILDKIGLSTSAAVGMLFRQIIFHQGLPFEARLPNDETAMAIKAAREGEVKSAGSAAQLMSKFRKNADAAKKASLHNQV